VKTFTRRDMVVAGGSLAAVAGGGVALRSLLRRRFAPTPYDDLLALLSDRDAAAQIGEPVLAQVDDFEPVKLAARLRQHVGGHALAAVLGEDAAAGRLIEGGGWVLPETLGLICALAAKAAS
jgi:hypothetical protein